MTRLGSPRRNRHKIGIMLNSFGQETLARSIEIIYCTVKPAIQENRWDKTKEALELIICALEELHLQLKDLEFQSVYY